MARTKTQYYRMKDRVEVFRSGKYMDCCNEADKSYPTKNAILVSVEEVFDLDKCEKVDIAGPRSKK